MKFESFSIVSKEEIIDMFCLGKRVLDVGSVGQDMNFKSEDWIFKKIENKATTIIGCDIDQNGIEELCKLGIIIVNPRDLDPLLNVDAVTMFDVIEHVDNVIEFINFYKKFIKKGYLVITTPNPFNIRQFFNILLFKKPSVNPEHTCWIDPTNFKEICRRTNLEIVDFYWLNEYNISRKWYWKMLSLKMNWMARFRAYFQANYCIVLRHEQ